MEQDAARLWRRVRRLRRLLDDHIASVAWKTFHAASWHTVLGSTDGKRSDPTFAAVAALEADEEYQALRKAYREALEAFWRTDARANDEGR